MEFVIRKTQEFGLSPKRQSRSRSGRLSLSTPEGPEKLAKIRQPKAGCRSLSDCLSVQPKTTPNPLLASTSCKAFTCQSQGTSPFGPPPPPNQPAEPPMEEMVHNFLRTTERGLSHSKHLSTSIQPKPAFSQVPLHAQGHQMNLQGSSITPPSPEVLGGDVDPLFIRAVTAVEMVCGERMYKCSACLHYYPGLTPLVQHIREGWRNGFSCRVFYRKLKAMRDRRVATSAGAGPGAANGVPSTMTISGCTPQPSTITTTSTTPAAMATEGAKSQTVKEKKMERVHEWLEKSVMMPQ
ncbi:hypothetical protein AALO_G00257760 [Alosa alosa]|uniref:Uncharacterized protein n=1 Tax=Alosa alosa TaxID=278164 RepID=A0AAV6FU43_9TELE|nr:hypothetical protein AALO_G00257760 [Alosa alosa]